MLLIDGLHLTLWRPCWRYNTKEYAINSIVGSNWCGWLTLSSISREIDSKPRIGWSLTTVDNRVSCRPRMPRMSPQPGVVEALEKQSPIQSLSRRENDITDDQFNAVELPGFKRLLHVLEPRYQVPSKSTFSRDRLTKLYDATRGNAMVEIKNNVNFYAAATDMWSSRGLIPYIGFILHWIDHEWVLQNRTVGTKYVPDEHTAEQLANCVMKTR